MTEATKILTHTSIVVDRTGSMSQIKAEAEAGVQNYLDQLTKVKGTVSLYQFDRHYDHERPDGPILEHVYTTATDEAMPVYHIEPRGNTPLYDAVAMSIIDTRSTVNNLEKQGKRPDKVALVIMTDGAENSSREYDFASVSKLIKEAQEEWGWRIEFLAGTLAAQQFAVASGLRTNTTHSFDTRSKGATRNAYTASAGQTVGWYEAPAEGEKDSTK